MVESGTMIIYDAKIKVELVDHLGSDKLIAETARLSHGGGECTEEKVETLIAFLLANKHMTPFEFAEIIFQIKAPLFAIAQIERHRTGTFLEQSFRYCKADLEFYKPATVNEQLYNAILHESTENYKTALKYGWKYEDARIGLAQNVMKTFRMAMDVRNLLHFFDLRMSKNAQEATREVATQMYEITKNLFPITIKNYENYK